MAFTFTLVLTCIVLLTETMDNCLNFNATRSAQAVIITATFVCVTDCTLTDAQNKHILPNACIQEALHTPALAQVWAVWRKPPEHYNVLYFKY